MNLFIYQDCQKSNQDLTHWWKWWGKKPLLVQLLHYLLPAPFLFHMTQFLTKIFPSFLKLGSTSSSKAVISALTCIAEGYQVYWQSRENVYMKKGHILNSTFFFFYVEQITGWVSSFPIITISCLTVIHQLHHLAYWNINSVLALYTAMWLNSKVPKWTLLYHFHSYTRCHAQLRHEFKSIYNFTYFTIYISSLQLQNKFRLTLVPFEFLLELKFWKLN